MTEYVEYTEEEIQAKIDAIYAKHPYLKDREPTALCQCIPCEANDIRNQYGSDAADAWEELDQWRWLLGE